LSLYLSSTRLNDDGKAVVLNVLFILCTSSLPVCCLGPRLDEKLVPAPLDDAAMVGNPIFDVPIVVIPGKSRNGDFFGQLHIALFYCRYPDVGNPMVSRGGLLNVYMQNLLYDFAHSVL